MTKAAVVDLVRNARPVKTPTKETPKAVDPLAMLQRWMVTDEQVDAMQKTEMIWRDLMASSHLATWAAPGNGGKTTVARYASSELAADGSSQPASGATTRASRSSRRPVT